MMDIRVSQLADNAAYYLYLADTGRHIKSDDRKTQERPRGLVRWPLFPVLPQQLDAFQSPNCEMTKGQMPSPFLCIP